jgi:hypothetical protein
MLLDSICVLPLAAVVLSCCGVVMLVRISILASLLLGYSSFAFGQSHQYIDQSRSSFNKNVYIQTSVEGEYGRYQMLPKEGSTIHTESWRGYGIRNGVGVEVMKFVQFGLSHTLVNSRSNESSLETLNGSRLSADLALSFSAPICNLQFGIGMIGSQMEYQALQQSSSFTGTGHYYSVGTTYFLTPSISFQTNFKRVEANSKLTGGTAQYSQFKANTDNLSLGIGVWL